MRYNISRHLIEFSGKSHAKIVESHDSHHFVRALGLYDLAVSKQDKSLTPSLITLGYWESWITSWFTKNVRPGMTVVDIGANCGYYTMLSELLVGDYGHVVAYEPNPEYAKLLLKTRERNKANFYIRRVALGDKIGQATLSIPKFLHGSSSIVGDFEGTEHDGTNIEVWQTTLDDELFHNKFKTHDIIKIDAESAEEIIFEGAGMVLNDDYHTTLLIEWTPGAYSPLFYKKLNDWGNITKVTFEGDEAAVDEDTVNNATDWIMLVIRKK